MTSPVILQNIFYYIACIKKILTYFFKVYSRFKKLSAMCSADEYKDYCNNGNLELAIQFYENNPHHYIYYVNPQLFKNACIDGHLNVAQWLLSITPSINVSDDEFNILFRSVCFYGHLHVAQWLLSLNHNTSFDKSAFRISCKFRRYHVALWLLTLSQSMDIISLATNSALNYFAKSFLLYCLHHKNICLFL
jgi:hypothetical protein